MNLIIERLRRFPFEEIQRSVEYKVQKNLFDHSSGEDILDATIYTAVVLISQIKKKIDSILLGLHPRKRIRIVEEYGSISSGEEIFIPPVKKGFVEEYFSEGYFEPKSEEYFIEPPPKSSEYFEPKSEEYFIEPPSEYFFERAPTPPPRLEEPVGEDAPPPPPEEYEHFSATKPSREGVEDIVFTIPTPPPTPEVKPATPIKVFFPKNKKRVIERKKSAMEELEERINRKIEADNAAAKLRATLGKRRAVIREEEDEDW